MEFILGYVMIAMILLFAGFSIMDIGILTLLLIALFIVLIGLFFTVCLALLAMSRRVKAVFAEFDEERRFPTAIYKLDGKDVPNMFPAEMIMKSKLYIPDKEITLLYCKPRRAVIDKNALVTMIAGSAVFIPAAVFAVILIISYFNGL